MSSFKLYLKSVWYRYIDPNFVETIGELDAALALLQTLELRLFGDRSINDKVEAVYAAYPRKCLVSSRTTCKGSKDRKKIKIYLESGRYNEQELITIIQLYIKECMRTNTFMKNFQTFLNNLPAVEDFQDNTPEQNNILDSNTDDQINAPMKDVFYSPDDIDKMFI